ncbi:bifunctional lysylphosphatidylglycerol flippase/synthetase MprF [Tabrizicola sp. J26]|nr:bifunctional lysylphosphatidylglycerol flippase/synthetase MprF [Tabrizicola rongguiensis]
MWRHDLDIAQVNGTMQQDGLAVPAPIDGWTQATDSSQPEDPPPFLPTEDETGATPTPLSQFFVRNRTVLSALSIIIVFCLMALTIDRLTSEIRYEDVLAALDSLQWTAIAWAVIFTALSFIALAFYDLNALEFVARRLPVPSVVATSFIAYAVGNTVGFGALSGGAIRFRAYSRLGLSPGEIARVIAFVTLAFGLGLVAVSALATLAVAPQIAMVLGSNTVWLRFLAVAVLVALGVLLILGRDGHEVRVFGHSLNLPDTRTSSRQFLVSAADIAASASVLYVLLPETHLGWPTFVALYATAIGIGVLSHVPAGLGVFETVMIAALGKTIGIDQLVGSLVVYRLIYHVLPLLAAVAMLAVTEMQQVRSSAAVREAGQVAGRLAPSLLSAFALVLGAMLIFSSVTPANDAALVFLSYYVPLPILEASHFLSSVLGLLLVIAARGIGQRSDGAWAVAIGTAALALVLAVTKAVAIGEAVMLGVFIAAMLLSRASFTRHASLTAQVLGPTWLAAIGVLVIAAAGLLLFIYRDTQYSHELWWQFEFSEEGPRSLRALLGLVLVSTAVALRSLLRPIAHRPDPAQDDDIRAATEIVMQQDQADANLVRMGDKHLLFSESRRAFLMYGIQGRSWIALLDPIGDEADHQELVWSFIEMARANAGRPVFYQISPQLLSCCADAGLRAFKLGELAAVDLASFDVKGRRNAGFRQAISKGEREGLSFEILEAEDVADVVDRLQEISDAWLEQHQAREKRFSLGAFSRDYVCMHPVAILRRNGDIVAFATLLRTETKAEFSVDLMRFHPDAPNGAMDYLFVRIMLHARDAGYRSFNLGMAPLSGMSRREAAPVWDRIGSTLFEHGERFYNFRGLRAFKAKFHPTWVPRYLAVTNGTGAALALMDITLLISGGVRGVVGK